MSEKDLIREINSTLTNVKQAYNIAISLVESIKPEDLASLLEELNNLCPSCKSLEDALKFRMYLSEELKEVADQVLHLLELEKSGRLSLNLDAIYTMINKGTNNYESPIPYQGFWSIIIIMLTLLKEVKT